MMKFKWMMLFCMIALLGISACSSDDGDVTEKKDGSGVVVGRKKLVKLVEKTNEGTEYGTAYVTKFTYDNEGHLVKTTGYGYHLTFVWEQGRIVQTINYGQRADTCVYELANNLVNSWYAPRYGSDFLSYSSSSQLLSVSTDMSGIYATYKWSQGKMVETDYGYGDRSYTLSYSGKTCNGYNPLVVKHADIGCGDITYAHPELFGLSTTQLYEKMESDDGTATWYYSYEFDGDGYVTKATETYTYINGKKSTKTYTFTWE